MKIRKSLQKNEISATLPPVLFAGFLTLSPCYALEDDQLVLEELPDVVRATLDANALGIIIEEIELDTEDPEFPIYEIEGEWEDQDVELEISALGELLEFEREDEDDEDDEESLTFEELPEDIAGIIQSLFPNLVADEVEREMEDGVTVFEVEGFDGGAEVSVEITESGEILEIESSAGLVSVPGLPEAVQVALSENADGAVIYEYKKKTNGDSESYKFEGLLDEQELELSIATDGVVLSVESEDVGHDDDEDYDDDEENEEEIAFEELPEDIAGIVLSLFPNLVVDEVERETEHGVTVFEVEGFDGADEVSVEIAETGEILEIENSAGLSTVPGLPEAVEVALSENADGAVIQEYKKKASGDNELFKFEGLLNGQELELSIAGGGMVLAVDFEAHDREDDEDYDNDEGSHEESLTFEELPEDIASIVLSLFPNLVADEVEREVEDGVTVYEVEGLDGADEVSVEITDSGEIVELESSAGLTTVPGLPEAVQVALSENFTGAVIYEYEKEVSGENEFYEFEGLMNEQELELSIAADGRVLSVDLDADDHDEEENEDDGEEHEGEITIDQLPEAIQTAMASAYPDFHYREIERETVADEERYEVEGCLEDGQAIELLFAANGELIRMEVDSDDDGLCDADEIDIGADPEDPDTDDDVFPDGFEVDQSSDPTDPNSQPQVLSVSLVNSAGVKAFDVCVETFAAGIYQLEEYQDSGHWVPVGEPFQGDGESCNVAVSISETGLGIFRVVIQSTAAE